MTTRVECHTDGSASLYVNNRLYLDRESYQVICNTEAQLHRMGPTEECAELAESIRQVESREGRA